MTIIRNLVFLFVAVLFGVSAHFLRAVAEFSGFPDGGRTPYQRCVEPMADLSFLIPVAGSAAILILLLLKPSWRSLLYAVSATILTMLIWTGAADLPCGGLDNGKGG